MRKLIASAWLGVGWPESTCQTSKSNSDISPFIAVERERYQSWKLNYNERKGEVLFSDGSLWSKLDKWPCINFLRNLLKWINTRDQLSWDLWNEPPSFFQCQHKRKYLHHPLREHSRVDAPGEFFFCGNHSIFHRRPPTLFEVTNN